MGGGAYDGTEWLNKFSEGKNKIEYPCDTCHVSKYAHYWQKCDSCSLIKLYNIDQERKVLLKRLKALEEEESKWI